MKESDPTLYYGIGFLFFLGACFMAYRAYRNHNLLIEETEKAEKHTDEALSNTSTPVSEMTAQDKLAFNKKHCPSIKVGVGQFNTDFRVGRVLETEEREDGKVYRMRGLTKRYGIPWGCELDKNDNSKCVRNTHIYDINDDEDERFYSGMNMFDASTLGHDDFYESSPGNDERIRGMTAAEASTECYNNKRCGTVVLPKCEPGYLFMTDEHLNKVTKGDNASRLADRSKWLETNEYFSNGRFTNSACVRVKSGASLSQLNGVKPEDADATFESNLGSILDFSNVRSLNFDSAKPDMHPMRSVLFYPKSSLAEITSKGAGPANKIKSSRESMYSLDIPAYEENIMPDAFQIQSSSGSKDVSYDYFLKAVREGSSPCDIARRAGNAEVRSLCTAAVPGWDPYACETRDTQTRDMRGGRDEEATEEEAASTS